VFQLSRYLVLKLPPIYRLTAPASACWISALTKEQSYRDNNDAPEGSQILVAPKQRCVVHQELAQAKYLNLQQNTKYLSFNHRTKRKVLPFGSVQQESTEKPHHEVFDDPVENRVVIVTPFTQF
jgi:hypothetical protein